MENKNAKVGFTEFAETWNGRLAMLGFVIGLATEFLTGQGILSQIGLIKQLLHKAIKPVKTRDLCLI
jgi:Chlorophyll A-B binding protein.